MNFIPTGGICWFTKMTGGAMLYQTSECHFPCAFSKKKVVFLVGEPKTPQKNCDQSHPTISGSWQAAFQTNFESLEQSTNSTSHGFCISSREEFLIAPSFRNVTSTLYLICACTYIDIDIGIGINIDIDIGIAIDIDIDVDIDIDIDINIHIDIRHIHSWYLSTIFHHFCPKTNQGIKEPGPPNHPERAEPTTVPRNQAPKGLTSATRTRSFCLKAKNSSLL